MSFFDRNRAKYVKAGVDAARIPPGQYVTERWPVLHEGAVPALDTDQWTFRVDGLVADPTEWSWSEFSALGRATVHTDIHCVTKWTKLDTDWEGVPVRAVWDAVGADPNAGAVMVHAIGGYTANLPVDDFLRTRICLPTPSMECRSLPTTAARCDSLFPTSTSGSR